MIDDLSTSILVFESKRQCVDCAAMALAENLQQIRTDKKLSQSRLAKLSGVSQQSISRLEAGLDQSSKHLPRIAAALGVPVASLDQSYLSTIPTGDWVDSLKAAIQMAAESGATLKQLRDVLDETFYSYLATHLRSRIGELSPEQQRSVEEAVDKIVGRTDSSETRGTRDT